MAVRRYGQLIGLRPEKLEEYRRNHAGVWPEILKAIRKAGIRNYSIFHFGGQLFAYFEYTGPPEEFEARMEDLARAPRMREWLDIMDPSQLPVEGRAPGEWWANMEEVFRHDGLK
jgi:L-rhamnose mutarotase